MLKVRVIPTLLWKDVGLVKGVGFDSWRRVGTVLPAIKVYNTRDVDELILLDITATDASRPPDFDAVADVTSESFVPLTVGGGITDVNHVRELLRAGADKVSINSAAYTDQDLIRSASSRFGVQCIVGSIDARRTGDGGYECYSHSGQRATGIDPVTHARGLEKLGVGEILITSVEQDGTMGGYELQLIKAVADAVSIPVIASGGAGKYGHLVEAIQAGGASAVAAASIFHFTEQTPLEAKAELARAGVAVRNSNVRVAG